MNKTAFSDILIGDAPAFVPQERIIQEHNSVRGANCRVLVRDRNSPDFDPFQETSGLCIPITKQPHPLVDYQKYKLDGGVLDLDPKNSRDALMLTYLQKIEHYGGILKFLWSTAQEICDYAFDDEYDKMNIIICEYYITHISMPARIATLSAYDNLSEPDDWPYEAFSNGYHLSHIANTLRVSKAKLTRDFMKNGSKLVTGQISRTLTMLDNAHQIQDHIMNKTIAANIRNEIPDQDEQKYISAVGKMISDLAPIMTNVAKAYVPDFAPKPQKLQVSQEAPPMISINTYAQDDSPYQMIDNDNEPDVT